MAQGVRVFVGVVSSLLLFKVLGSPVPVQLVIRFILLIRLRVWFKVTQVRTYLSPVIRLLVIATNLYILVDVLASTTRDRGQARARHDNQVYLRRDVASWGSVFVVGRGLFLLRGRAACPMCDNEGFLALRFPSVLISPKTMVIALVLVGPRIGFDTILCRYFVRQQWRCVIFVVRLERQGSGRSVVFSHVTVGGNYAVMDP